MSPKHLTEKSPLAAWLQAIETCHPAEIELGLERMREVANRLPLNLDQSIKVVVGGTNGKGTSIRLMEAILIEAGFSVATYTSPHFLHYNERITLSGTQVDDDMICLAFSQIESQRQGVPLTYFEFGTLAALLIFSQQKPDILLLEVGLGGRLDSVNIVDSDIALITTIALDHIEWLGPDRESIGFEKAGIFRSNCPAVCGDPDAPQSLIKHAQALNTKLYCNGRDYSYSQTSSDSWLWKGIDVKGHELVLKSLPIPHVPIQNAAAVLQLLQCINLSISIEHIVNGIIKAQLTGRMQLGKISGYPCVLDVAHNPESASYLANYIKIHKHGKVHLVLGMLADKDLTKVCEALLSVVDYWHLVTLHTPRGATASQLKAVLESLGVTDTSMTEYASVESALTNIPNVMDAMSQIVIAGSFYTVSQALNKIQ